MYKVFTGYSFISVHKTHAPTCIYTQYIDKSIHSSTLPLFLYALLYCMCYETESSFRGTNLSPIGLFS